MNRPKLLFVWLHLLFVASLGSAVTSVAQVHARLRDLSEGGSPVRVSGQATFRGDSESARYRFEVNASATNVSQKSILLFVIHFEAKGPSGPKFEDNYQHEYYFAAEPLEPGSVEDVGIAPLRIGVPVVNGEQVAEGETRSQSSASARVEFVQFSDGSVWGNSQSALDALNTRQQTLQELEVLEQTYSQAGEQAFLDELSKPTFLTSIDGLKSKCKGDSRCARDAVHGMIQAARYHETAAKGETSPNSGNSSFVK